MAKDAKGHGSEARGAHQAGVEQSGRRFHVQVQPYSLEAGKVGQSLNRDQTLSTHHSIGAAGDKLGSLISGNKRDLPYRIAGLGNGYRLVVRDMMTGHDYSRNQARAIHQGKWNGALPAKAR